MHMILRYPPSPTWSLHVWTLRTCLYNFLYAKKHWWKIIFRSEDTDKSRSTIEFENDIIDGLKKMGLMDDDTPIFRQSERTEIYKKYLQKLLDSGNAYYCFMTPEELEKEKKEQREKKLPPRYSWKFRDYPIDKALERIKSWEKAVIRLKVPENEIITFTDLVKWDNTVNTKELDDFVIAKSMEYPLYHITVVVDDHEMWITHVLRWEDHISNTPKQILIYRALWAQIPEFWHFPLILNEDKSKLSKRKNKVSVDDFLNEWYMQDALINFLALLWWNTADEKEIFSLVELIEEFSLERVNNSWAIFDVRKLDWINGVYIKNFSINDLKEKIEPFLNDDLNSLSKSDTKTYDKMLEISHDRLKKLSDINNDFVWYFNPKKSDPEMYPHKKMKVTIESAKDAIESVLPFLESIEEDLWDKENLTLKLVFFIEKTWQKNAYYLWPLRVALTREQFSPGTMEVMAILWKGESLERIKDAVSGL